ncbi:glyco protein 3 alpha L fucosyltransferase A [Trichuris trichiura]|uniref:Fucosyltransferase n=1 Tax=Trichuris trichiura TaxID=36087 RepID=A0A077YYT0_TRITR|nr:glyco protein 3 alpha L fucosyltransferase A [Trichuris trichiura]
MTEDDSESLSKPEGEICEVEYSWKSSKKASLVGKSDALVFDFRDVRLSAIFLPKKVGQKFVFYSRETTPEHFAPLLGMNTFFDMSMTYLPSSAVFCPYGSFVKKRNNKTVRLKAEMQSLAKRKRLVFWLASKCSTHSGREWYILALKRYIQVDVYGKCGGTVLPKGPISHLTRKYKFRIVFENTVCQQYITERFYEALLDRTVPIVLQRSTYASAPQGSFIAVDDFRSARDLAEYLNFLNANESEYLKYFRWIETTDVKLIPSCTCQLASALLSGKLRENKSKQLNLYEWWQKSNDCKFNFAKRYA